MEGGRRNVMLVYAWTEEVGTKLLYPSRTYRAFKRLCPREKSKSKIKRERWKKSADLNGVHGPVAAAAVCAR